MTPTTTNFCGFTTIVTTANFGVLLFAAHNDYSNNKGMRKINTSLFFLNLKCVICCGI